PSSSTRPMPRAWTRSASTRWHTRRRSPASTDGGREAGIGDSGFGTGWRPERIRFPDRPRAFPNPGSRIPNPMITAEHLRKTFPGKGKDKSRVVAVDDVGFQAHDGQITGLLGPNGAGKTTTLRMLYSLMAPERGHIEVDGIDPARDPMAVRRSLGVLPDARGVYKRLTARENIAYFARLQ